MFNPGYEVDVIDPYYPPVVEVIDPFYAPPVEIIEVMPPQPAYMQRGVYTTQPQPVIIEERTGPTQGEVECCLMLGACCVMEECGLCVIS